jgi:hypothetical protein
MTKHFTTSLIRNEIIQLSMAVLFAAAMGLLEAIIVIYIRDIILPAGYNLKYPVAPLGSLPYELIREACTLLMLITAAWLAGFNNRARIYYFFIMFGIWDIMYYAGLKFWLDWPATWLSWDCLFLIPEPWYGPVLAPVLISIYLIAGGTMLLLVEKLIINTRLHLVTILLNLAAFGIWYWSFVKDSSVIQTKGYRGVEYSWILFVIGVLLANVGIVYSVIRNYRHPLGKR